MEVEAGSEGGGRELLLHCISLTGLKYHEHLSVPIPRSETQCILAYVQAQVSTLTLFYISACNMYIINDQLLHTHTHAD